MFDSISLWNYETISLPYPSWEHPLRGWEGFWPKTYINYFSGVTYLLNAYKGGEGSKHVTECTRFIVDPLGKNSFQQHFFKYIYSFFITCPPSFEGLNSINSQFNYIWYLLHVSKWFFYSDLIFRLNKIGHLRRRSSAWKMSKYGVFSGPYFPALGLDTERYGVWGVWGV